MDLKQTEVQKYEIYRGTNEFLVYADDINILDRNINTKDKYTEIF
jgi:hypothetical protein